MSFLGLAPETTNSVEEGSGGDCTTQVLPMNRDTALDATCGGSRTPLRGSRFRVLHHCARGGLGDVFVAYDMELEREVALKEIQRCFADEPKSRSRFVVEAKVTLS